MVLHRCNADGAAGDPEMIQIDISEFVFGEEPEIFGNIEIDAGKAFKGGAVNFYSSKCVVSLANSTCGMAAPTPAPR